MQSDENNITLKEAANRGYDIYSLLGVDKDTKQLIKNKAVDMAPVIEAIEAPVVEVPVIEAPVVEAPVVELKQKLVYTDFEAFSAWCIKEFGRKPSMQDYKDAIEYYGDKAMQSIESIG